MNLKKYLSSTRAEINLESGHVEKTYEKGSTYKGEFQDGKRHGQGVFTTAKGDRYEGIWENNKLNGHGILIGVNGS